MAYDVNGFLSDYHYTDATEKAKRDARQRTAAAKALVAQSDPGSGSGFSLSGALKKAAGLGLEGLGAAQNYIGKPIAGPIVKAVSDAANGDVDVSGIAQAVSPLVRGLGAVRQAASGHNPYTVGREQYQQFESNPNVPTGIKVGAGIVTDPTTYAGVGLASHLKELEQAGVQLPRLGKLAAGLVAQPKGAVVGATLGASGASQLADSTHQNNTIRMLAPLLGGLAGGIAGEGRAVRGLGTELSSGSAGLSEQGGWNFHQEPLDPRTAELLGAEVKNPFSQHIEVPQSANKVIIPEDLKGVSLGEIDQELDSVRDQLKTLWEETRKNPDRLQDGDIAAEMQGLLGRERDLKAAAENYPAIGGGALADPSILHNAISQAKPLQGAQQELNSQLRNRQATSYLKDINSNQGGEAGFVSARGAMSGAGERVQFTPLRSTIPQADIDSLMNTITTHPDLQPFEQVGAGTAFQDLLDGRVPTPSNLNHLETAFPGVTKSLQEANIANKPNWLKAISVGSINQALRASNVLMDFATGGRLGPQLALDHPTQYFSALKDSLKSVVDPEIVAQRHQSINDAAVASGGVLPTMNELKADYKIPVGNPDTATGLASKLPGVVGRATQTMKNFQEIVVPDLVHEEIKNRLNAGTLTPADLNSPAVREDIGRGVRLLTGQSTHRMGDASNLLLEFPNWLVAQGELIKSATERGTITGSMARKSLGKLVAYGTAATAAINLAQGESPLGGKTLVPTAKIPGTDLQVDMFGPLGALIDKIAGIGQAGLTGGPQGAVSQTFNAYRGLASPVAKLAIDQVTKSDAVGGRVSTPLERIGNVLKTAEPFNTPTLTNLPGVSQAVGQLPSELSTALQGTRSQSADVLGLLGAKVYEPSAINQALSDAGITQSDPDFLIKRKDFLTQHPELRQSNDIGDLQTRISQARQQLDEKLRTDPSYTLQNFRDDRTKILQDQRDSLRILVGDNSGSPLGGSKQANWIKSYQELFPKSTDLNSPSSAIDTNKFDQLLGDWINTNGQQALDFVERYLGAGTTPTESAYYNDLRQLDADGYFQMPKYQNMRSGLTDQQISDNRAKVEAVRAQSPNPLPFIVVAKQVLPNLSPTELQDIVNSSRQAFQSKERAAYQATHRKELMWFNPNANWDTYQNATNGAKRGSGVVLPRATTSAPFALSLPTAH